MPKAAKGKSSASSATRKKNAAKAAKKSDPNSTDPSSTSKPPKAANQPAQRGEKKSKKERREALAKAKKKSYVPPSKPPQPPPDPLDSMGLASLLQPDLVVLLRKLGKKDIVTRERALEGLKNWLEGKDADGKPCCNEDWELESRRNDALVMLPSWLHLFPRLSISPTRKLRLLTTQILSSLISLPGVRQELFFNPSNQESLLGPWSVLTWDNDKLVSKTCKELWDLNWSHVFNPDASTQSDETENAKLELNPETLDILLNHLNNVLLSSSPSQFLSLTFSSQAPVSISSSHQSGVGGDSTPISSIGRDAKNRDEMNLEEGREDTDGRLKSGSLGCLNWIISTLSGDSNSSSNSNIGLPENLSDLLRNPKIYSSLTDSQETSIPSLRIKTYQLLSTLNSHNVSQDFFKNHVLDIISPEAPLSLWQEKDLGVIRSGIDSLLPIFRKYSSMWESQLNAKKVDDEEDDEDDEEDDEEEVGEADSDDSDDEGEDHNLHSKTLPTSIQSYTCYNQFKSFLERGLSPAPQLAYPTVLLFLTTIPSTVLKFDYESSNELLSSIHEPFGSRDLDSDNRGDINAFLGAFLECFGWLSRRLSKEGTKEDAEKLIQSWFERIWSDFVIGSKEETSSDKQEEEGSEDRFNRKSRSYNSISNPKLSAEFGSVFKKIFNSSENDACLSRFLDSIKASIEDSLKNGEKSRKEIEKIIGRSLGIFESLIKRDDSLDLKNDPMEKVQALIQGLMNDTIKSLKEDSSSEAQQRKLIFLSNSITSKNLSWNLNLTNETRSSLTSLSEEILPKIISDGKLGGQNHAELIGSTMKLLSGSKQSQDSTNGLEEMPKGSGTQVWVRALEASILLKDENQRIGNILQILQAEESSRKKEESTTTQNKTGEEEQVEEEDAERPLDEISISLASEFCSSNNQKSSELEKLIQTLLLSGDQDGKKSFAISQDKIDETLMMLCSKISGVHSAFVSSFSSPKSKTSSKKSRQLSQDYTSLIPVLRVFKAWVSKDPEKRLAKLRGNELFFEIPKIIFELSFLKSQDESDEDLQDAQKVAKEIWLSFDKAQGKEVELLEIGRQSLSSRLEECEIPLDVIFGASEGLSGPGVKGHLIKLLPSIEELEGLAEEVASEEPDSTLSILDPLVPSTESSIKLPPSNDTNFDPQGFSIYSRFSLLLLKSIQDDLRFAKTISSWLIPHLLLFSILIEDKLSDESSSSNDFFSRDCNLIELKNSFRNIIKSLTSLISSLSNDLSDDWHVQTVAILQREKGDGSHSAASSEDHDPLRASLLTVYRLSKSSMDSHTQFSRVFNKLLSGIMSFSSISSVDGERWLKLGQSLMIQFPYLACSIFYSVKSLASSTPFYDRLRNDLASRLAGVPASKANDEGIKLLTLLLSVAPNAETGDIALIPQQRSIFLLQTFQKWFASDEDLEDELNCKLVELFIHLLPIIQDLQGSHLDLIFDLLESNLDLVEIEERETWGMMFSSLKLLDQIRDLSGTNKMLKAAWRERKDPIWEKVHDLFLELAPASIHSRKKKASPESKNSGYSLPREIVAELLVDLVREVPSSAFSNKKDEETLIRLMTGNAQDGSVSKEMQVVAYKLLSACISDKVKELVVEAAVGKSRQETGDEQGEVSEPVQLDLTLPSSLLEIASASVNSSTAQILLEDQSSMGEIDDEEEMISDLETAQEGRKTVFGLLLCWMAIFDHFEEASLQIRSAYLSQIEKMELTPGLASTVFNLLNGEGGRGSSNSFEAGKWGIEEVGLDDLDVSNGLSLQALASHVYLRSLTHLPTLIRSWWFSLKDRQLSMSVSSFTVKHCSPSIASRELSHLRREDSLSKLEDEAMTIKFQGSNEVIATYVVDEHPIEMGVKIPNDFPLHAIEIRDPADAGKRVGISEAQWRAWILATQQLITSKNGLILDALMLFKKNAEAKFAGFEGAECAICYSIISPTDRSLPVKPCPTCKNRFHASCLFKWVTTSGSSTCPLCRSVI